MKYLGSVLLYGLNAAFVFFCVKYARLYRDKKHIYYLLILLAVFVPSVLGGIRYGIGTDYFVRYLPDYQILENDLWGKTRVEFGFELIGRITVLFDLGFQFMLFIVQLLTNGFILAALMRYEKEIDPELGMFFYMLLYYQCSYNLVRQCFSMAIVFYALRYVEERKLLKFLLVCAIAATIHLSSFVVFFVYFLEAVWTRKKYRYIKWIVFALLLSIIFFFEPIFNMLNKFLPIDYYSRYITDSHIEDISAYFFIKWFFYLVPGTAIILYRNRGNKEVDPPYLKRYRFFLAYTICGFLLSITSYMESKHEGLNAFFRISYYFNMGLIYLIPRQCKLTSTRLKFQGLKQKVKLFSTMAVVFMLVIWYYEYFVRGQSMTVPYQSIFSVS